MNLDRRRFVAGLVSAAAALAGFAGLLRRKPIALPYAIRIAERGGMPTNRILVVTEPDASAFDAIRTPGVPHLYEKFDGATVVSVRITQEDEYGRWIAEIETLT